MSQGFHNDLSVGSPDEDDEDEEAMGWAGERGNFDVTNRDDDEVEEHELGQFGRGDFFHDRWTGDLLDDEFGPRTLGTRLTGGYDLQVSKQLAYNLFYRVLMTTTTRRSP